MCVRGYRLSQENATLLLICSEKGIVLFWLPYIFCVLSSLVFKLSVSSEEYVDKNGNVFSVTLSLPVNI